MFTNKLPDYGEHPLGDGSLQIGSFLAVWAYAEGLFNVPGKVFLLMLPRVEELFGRGGTGNHHHRFTILEIRVGDSRVQVPSLQIPHGFCQ